MIRAAVTCLFLLAVAITRIDAYYGYGYYPGCSYYCYNPNFVPMNPGMGMIPPGQGAMLGAAVGAVAGALGLV
ncbi:unnamed protein product [Nippostrongylus brasiliensis]|uniref:Uncharacterized protein n=1 Tax=Nippostrongylus brasiliensis TaxID=27835 RepID=A0A0N4Y9D9_NIPBR|nr:hypothetical protein Q1695_005248 [Nippostrongylus brasiliensis]VDL76499.1 unnamed protein product [Nippostrongylus brasiliensis]